MNNRLQIGYFFSDRHAGYYQVLATAHIRLYQHTDAKNGLLFYMKAVDIVESAIPGFPHYRKTENSSAGKLPRAPLDDRVPYYTHTVGIGKQHRSFQEA